MRAFSAFAFAVLSHAMCGSALSEGLPVNRETWSLNSPHLRIFLSESQIEEIDALGTATLTSKQWADLRKTSPRYPKRVTVLPMDTPDCTCGLSDYMIRISKNEIAALKLLGLRTRTTFKDYFEYSRPIGEEDTKLLVLRIDSVGNVHFNGARFSPIDIEDYIKESQGKELLHARHIVFNLPGVKSSTNALNTALAARLVALAREHGWTADVF